LSKVLIISDTHAGCRGDNPFFYAYQKKFYDNILFPFIRKKEIKTFIHLGDLVDNRKEMNYATLQHLKDDFLDPLKSLNIETHFIVGNHDAYYKNTLSLNAMDEFIKFGRVYSSPSNILSSNISDILMVPWICRDNRDESLRWIKESKAKYCMGHLELYGFQTNSGAFSRFGEDKNVFKNFTTVFSGHFHQRSRQENIQYIGSTFKYNWGDYNQLRGLSVFDDINGTMDFYRNPYHIFSVLSYDGYLNGITDDDILKVKDTYCRIYVKNKTSEVKLNDFIKKVEDVGVIKLTVIDETDIIINDNLSEFTGEDDLRVEIINYINKLEVPNIDLVKNKFNIIYNKAKEK